MKNKKIINEKIVQHVAKLSRLSLEEKEIEAYSKQLEAILEYIAKLNEVDTSSTNPTSHPLKSMKNVFREDVVKKSLPVSEVLKNGPKTNDEYFIVPKVIE